jgi:hypothetical protein
MDTLIINGQTYCLGCGKPTEGKKYGQKYCNTDCYNLFRRKVRKHELHALVCQHCGGSFVSGRISTRFCSKACRSAPRWQSDKAAEPQQIELFPARRAKRACTCGNVSRCSECRRRKQAQEDGLEDLTSRMPPDVLAICLEVRALNTRKHQTAAYAAGD